MRFFTRFTAIVGGAGLLLWVSAEASSLQHHRGHHIHHHGYLPAYDAGTETTLEGTVEEVVQIARSGCRGCDGEAATHLFLSGHEVEVHLGPTSFLESKGCKVSDGDEFRVTGSRLTVRGYSLLLAKELHCGGETIVLRDENGRPLWRSQR